jgi:hypothetical protein
MNKIKALKNFCWNLISDTFQLFSTTAVVTPCRPFYTTNDKYKNELIKKCEYKILEIRNLLLSSNTFLLLSTFTVFNSHLLLL